MVMMPSSIRSDLKGKSADEITAKIEELKRSLERLKYEMEHPDYPYKPKCSPSDGMYMNRIREDLRSAKRILKDAGGTYCATAADLKYHAFCGSVESANTIKFTTGNYDKGFHTRIIDVKGEKLIYRDSYFFKTDDYSSASRKEQLPLTKKELLKGFGLLYLGEWRSWYDLRRYGMYLIGGKKWRLEIQFTNGYKPFICRGDNVYPYNFKEFEKLIGIGLKDKYDYWWRLPEYDHPVW